MSVSLTADIDADLTEKIIKIVSTLEPSVKVQDISDGNHCEKVVQNGEKEKSNEIKSYVFRLGAACSHCDSIFSTSYIGYREASSFFCCLSYSRI